MNKRIKKKKYNQWAAHNDDQTIDFGALVACAAEYKGIQQVRPYINERGYVECFYYTPEYVKFAKSKNVLRAVKSYAKKYVYHTGKCDNINEMYRYMCEEKHADKEYRRRLKEQLAQLTPEDFENVKEEWEHRQRCYDTLGIL